MTDEAMSRSERWAAADQMRAEERARDWGMHYEADERDPYALAHDAHQRGDHWFQIDLPVMYVQGSARMGWTSTLAARPVNGDVLGAIEREGWQLEHVSTTYVIRGHASTKRAQLVVGTSADDVAYHGELVGLYVFRRSDVQR